MPISGTTYKGLTIPNAIPNGTAGLAIYNNFKTIADSLETIPAYASSSKSTNYTVLTTDYGKTILCDATSAAFTVTLPAVASAGDGFWVNIVKIDASANAVTIDGYGSETINGTATYSLATQYDYATLICDGSEWFVVAQSINEAEIDADNLVLAYTGSNYTESDATLAGHLAGIDAELVAGLGALDQNNIVVLEDQKASGTDGQSLTTGGWRTRDLNTETDTGGLCTLSSSQFTLTAGTYLAIGSCPTHYTGNVDQTRLYNTTGTTTLLMSIASDAVASPVTNFSTIFGIFTVAGSQALELQTRVSANGKTGAGASWSEVNVYTSLILIKLA